LGRTHAVQPHPSQRRAAVPYPKAWETQPKAVRVSAPDPDVRPVSKPRCVSLNAQPGPLTRQKALRERRCGGPDAGRLLSELCHGRRRRAAGCNQLRLVPPAVVQRRGRRREARCVVQAPPHALRSLRAATASPEPPSRGALREHKGIPQPLEPSNCHETLNCHPVTCYATTLHIAVHAKAMHAKPLETLPIHTGPLSANSSAPSPPSSPALNTTSEMLDTCHSPRGTLANTATPLVCQALQCSAPAGRRGKRA
jgi:hypothetical protein